MWRNRLLAFWRKYVQGIWQFIEWPVILLFVLVILGAGYFGLKNYYSSLGQIRSLPDMLYSILQLFILGSNYVGGSINFELEIVRLLAPLFPFYMIIKLFGTVFQERIQLFYLKRIVRDHVVICGMNPRALVLARDFYGRGYRIVVIDSGMSKGLLEKCRDMDAIVLAGNASDTDMLRKAQVGKARYLIAVSDSESANAEAAVSAGRLAGESRSKVLTCYVHIADLQLWSLLRGFQLKMGRADKFRIEFVNIYNSGARVLLNKYPAKESIIIVGLGKMGENIAVEAARAWYFGGLKPKPHLVLVEKDAPGRKERLLRQFPRMAEACDIVPMALDIFSTGSIHDDQLSGLFSSYPDARIFICPGDDISGVSIALSMLPLLKASSCRAILCTEQDSGLVHLVNGEELSDGKGLEIFSLLGETYGKEVLLGGTNAILARAIHDDYVRKQKAAGVVSNPAVVPWDELPEDLKESNRRSADDILARLKVIGCDIMPVNDWGVLPIQFTAEEVETMSILEHQRWVRERLLQGYRYAPGPKDLAKKTSPYLVEWDKLTEDVKGLDRNVVRGIPGFLASEGFQVYRISGNIKAVASPPAAT